MGTNKYNVDQEVIVHGENYFILKFREVFGTYQYSLSKTKGGEFCFACGEFSIEEAVNEEECNHDGDVMEPDLSFLGQVTNFDTQYNEAAAYANTTSAIMRQPIDGRDAGIDENVARLAGSSLFFRPDILFVKWLIKYAQGRTIIDVGAGQGHLVRMIKQFGGKSFGLEPNFDHNRFVRLGLQRWGDDFDMNEMLPWTIERASGLINQLGAEKAMLVFARPCHSDFVEVGIRNMPDGMEALYITVPENLERYEDLGIYKTKATQLDHDGVSEDNEVVLSIIK